MVSLAGFRKRFCQRVIRDLPADLEAMECEDPLGVLRHHVPRLIDGVARHAGTRQPAYAHRALFGIPGSPPYSRLRSAEGYTPFHFAKNVVEGRTARAFDDYARCKERDAAPEQDAGRGQAIETGIDGASKDAYIRSHGGQGGGPADGWTNLADPSDWDTIEAFERDRRVNPDGNPPGVSIFYDRAPLLFDHLASDPLCPGGLRKTIAKEQARVAAGRPLSDRKARDGVRWTDERAFDTYSWIKSHPLWPEYADRDRLPARVSQGRAVQTHLAGEGEYHAALDAAARARIRAGMIDIVQRQRNPASMDGDGWFLPMTICDHAASGLNDPLNDHFHWLIGTRRARYKADGGLEFEPTKVNAITREGWIDTMREELARLTNVELATIGADVRYHAGTLEEMGIDAIAQKKMHGRRTILERAGASTALGLTNDTEGWRRAFAAAANDRDEALAAMDRELPATEPSHAAHRQSRMAAATLRHEAAEIQILIDMSRSRAARTMRFAPEYAAEASAARVVAGWRARHDEAERYLAALDAELAPERDGVADRLARAAALEIDATALTAAPEDQVSVLAPAREIAPSAADVHRAVDVIARTPLFVGSIDGRLVVDERDDPEQLVAGINLSGADRRLAGVRASQQRELAQVQAFVRRHGADALFDDTCETHSPWFEAAVRKWRDAPVMQRYLAAHDAHVVADRERDEEHRRRASRSRELEDATDLRSFADLPFLADLAAVVGDNATFGESIPTAAAAPSASTQPTPSAKPQPPSVAWTEMETRHREVVAWREKRDRQRTRLEIADAFADRVGSCHALTPYAARLVAKMAAGFDLAAIAVKVGLAGRTLDQRDAGEIAVLLRHPEFRAHIERASRTAGNIGAPATSGPDFLGRVGLVHDRLHFGPAGRGQAEPMRTPLEWAEQTLAVVLERQMPLTMRDGLVGVHDPEVLRASQHNYLGLLHPSIQHALDVQRRIQVEEERDILAKVRSGQLTIDVGIERDRVSGDVRTHVRLVDGPAEAAAFVARRQSDAGFYFRCRETIAGVPADAPALRSGHAAVRAWLAARDDGAASSVVNMLGDAVRKISDVQLTKGMTEADAAALRRMMSPSAVTARPGIRRTDAPRNQVPRYPGRPDRTR